jgi:two-component system response regulator FixJ
MNLMPWREEPRVFVVDRDPDFAGTLRKVVGALEVHAQWFPSAEEFLLAADCDSRGCLVIAPDEFPWTLDQWFGKLDAGNIHLPVIVASVDGDVPKVVEAMQAGALNYLQKPCEEEMLADALRGAIAWDAEHGHRHAEAARARKRLSRLTPGELQVLEMLIEGMTNQEVAAALGRSVRAIEVRRAKIREKMRVRSLAELLRLALAGLTHGLARSK